MSVTNTTRTRHIVNVHVYIGSKTPNNFNRKAFTKAVTYFNERQTNSFVLPTYFSCSEVKNREWDFEHLIDWLLDCDMHFVLTHIHQGPAGHSGVEEMGWDVHALYTDVLRLYQHPGFPNGEHLKCPIFTQDKFNYLQPLMSEGVDGFVNQTLKVELREDGNYDSILEELNRFTLSFLFDIFLGTTKQLFLLQVWFKEH